MHGITSGTFIISFFGILFKLLQFEQMCSYAMSKRYKIFFRPTKTSINYTPNKESVIKVKGAKKYKFRESHPGYNFSYLTKLKHPTIPGISLPSGKLCSLEELKLQKDKPTEESCDKRKMYAKWHFWCSIHSISWTNWPVLGATGKSFTKNYNTISTKKPQSFGKRALIYFKISKTGQPSKNTSKEHAMSTVKTKPKESTSDVTNSSRGNNNVLDILQIGIHSK
jgi:hypothetical protein